MVLAGRDNNRRPRIVKLELPHVIRELGNGGADADLRRRGGVLVAGLSSKGASTSACWRPPSVLSVRLSCSCPCCVGRPSQSWCDVPVSLVVSLARGVAWRGLVVACGSSGPGSLLFVRFLCRFANERHLQVSPGSNAGLTLLLCCKLFRDSELGSVADEATCGANGINHHQIRNALASLTP